MQPPDLPELEPRGINGATDHGELVLEGGLLDVSDGTAVAPVGIRLIESELRGLTVDAGAVRGLRLRDVILRECDMSNVDAREGSLRRVQIHGSRLVGLGLSGAAVQDVRVLDSTLKLATLAFAKLRDVVFERVDLTEASFIEASLQNTVFVDCRLAGADFRGVKLAGCGIYGTSLDGVVGIESLRGLHMDWGDMIASAPALADALGIVIDSE